MSLITDYKDDGYGHIQDLLYKYKDKYEEAGIDSRKITATGREYDIFRMMSDSSADTLEDLKKEINAAIKKYTKTETGGGGGGGFR